MPEWKSWTFGGEDENGFALPTPTEDEPSAPAPTPGMEADAAAAKWGVEVEPVSIKRIEKVIEGDGLPHASDEFVAVTEVNGIRMQFHLEPADSPWLQLEAKLPLEDESPGLEVLGEIANTWNLDHLQPTVFPLSDESSRFFILATRFFVAEGLSDRQIHAMVRRGVSVTVQALQLLPTLVAEADK